MKGKGPCRRGKPQGADPFGEAPGPKGLPGDLALEVGLQKLGVVPPKLGFPGKHRPAQNGAVPRGPLGEALHHHVGPPGQRPAERPRRPEGVVHDQGHARFLGQGGQGLEVGYEKGGVRHGLHEDRAGLCAQGLPHGLGLGVHVAHRYPHEGEHLAEKANGLAEKPLGRHHLVPRAEEGEEGGEGGRLARGQDHGLKRPLQGLEPLLQGFGRGVLLARVDVALPGGEALLALFQGFEAVGGHGVDGKPHRPVGVFGKPGEDREGGVLHTP